MGCGEPLWREQSTHEQALRNGETAQLQDPKIEDKETRPPPRYTGSGPDRSKHFLWLFELSLTRLRGKKRIGKSICTNAGIKGVLTERETSESPMKQWSTPLGQ